MSKQAVCKFIATRIMGWTLVGQPAPEDQCIILGAPHTSIWDFVISFFFYNGIGGHARVAVKSEFFVWPLKGILRWAGAIPVDRKRGGNFITQTIHALQKEKHFHLAIAPEGTRKPVKNWKRGFHALARHMNIPVYYGWFDWGKKEIGIGPRVPLTDDFNHDIEVIKAWYREKGVVGKHPEKFLC